MNRLFHIIMEVIYWVFIFLSPVILSGIIGYITFANFDIPITALYICLSIGTILGVLLAEYIRRVYGCVSFWSRILSTPDIWPTEKEKHNHKRD